MAQFLSAATRGKIELRRDRIITLGGNENDEASLTMAEQQNDDYYNNNNNNFSALSTTPVALAAIQGAFRCVEVVGSPVDANVIESLALSSANHNNANINENSQHQQQQLQQQTAAGTPSVAWCGEQDGSITIRQLSTGQIESRYPPTQRHIFPCSICNVCSVEVWVGYSDGGMKIFSPQREKNALVEFRGHSTTVSALAFSALGVDYHGVQFVVSASTDWTIIVWDARRDYSGQTPKQVSKVAIAKSPIKSLSSGVFSPFWVSQQQMKLYREKHKNNPSVSSEMAMLMAADDRDRNLICAGCGNGSVLVLELEPSNAVVNVLWETGGITTTNTPLRPGANSIYNTTSSTSTNQFNPSINAITFFQAHKGQFLVVSGSTNGQVIARNALDGTNPQIIEKRPSAVLSVSADKASGLLWIGGSDGVITVYNNELRHLATLQHHGGAYVSAIKSFSGNSSHRRVWVCGDDGQLRCFLLASTLMENENEQYFNNSMSNNNPNTDNSLFNSSRKQLLNNVLQDLRAKILRNTTQLQLLRSAAWKLRQREKLSLESFCNKNLKASSFIGGHGWELVALGIENIKMFRLKQRQYIIALQRSSYGGFRASIFLGRRYFIKWIFYSQAQRYRASSLLVAQQFQNRHRFDIQARYLSRLWRETLRIERGQQLMNVAAMLNSTISKGSLRTAYRRWLQWLATRRSFKSARKICNLIGKSTNQAILTTYWNALVSSTQHLEKMKKLGAATSSISRLTGTAMLKTYFEKWRKWRSMLASNSAFDQTMESRGLNRNKEIFVRYFRKWSEYFATMECQRMEEELARQKKEQEEWEAMIVCDKAKMEYELNERKPALQRKLDEEEAELRALEQQLKDQEAYHAALQRETLFINEDLPIDPNAPIQEQVACVIEFLKARCIHCLHDIKLVGELNKKALATLSAPPRVAGGAQPAAAPPIDTPFGAALFTAKTCFNNFMRDQGLPGAAKNTTLKGYTPPADFNPNDPTVDLVVTKGGGSRNTTPISGTQQKSTTTKTTTTTTPRSATATATAATKSSTSAPSPKPGGKKSALSKEERERIQRKKEEDAAKEALAKRRAQRNLPSRDQQAKNEETRKKDARIIELEEPYKFHWGIPLDNLDEARKFEVDRMVLIAKQLIVGYDTVHARSLLVQRQQNYQTQSALGGTMRERKSSVPPGGADPSKSSPIREEWLHEFLVNAHILLKVAIEEYRKRQKQGIETGGIDDLDLARSHGNTNPSSSKIGNARNAISSMRKSTPKLSSTTTPRPTATTASSSNPGTPTTRTSATKMPSSSAAAATSSKSTPTTAAKRPAAKPAASKSTSVAPKPAAKTTTPTAIKRAATPSTGGSTLQRSGARPVGKR